MKTILARLRAIVTKPRVMHYIDIFVAAFAVALLYDQQHILGAHGLNALKAVIFAATVSGAKAVFEAFRKDFNLPAAPTDTAAAAAPPPAKS